MARGNRDREQDKRIGTEPEEMHRQTDSRRRDTKVEEG